MQDFRVGSWKKFGRNMKDGTFFHVKCDIMVSSSEADEGFRIRKTESLFDWRTKDGSGNA